MNNKAGALLATFLTVGFGLEGCALNQQDLIGIASTAGGAYIGNKLGHGSPWGAAAGAAVGKVGGDVINRALMNQIPSQERGFVQRAYNQARLGQRGAWTYGGQQRVVTILGPNAQNPECDDVQVTGGRGQSTVGMICPQQ